MTDELVAHVAVPPLAEPLTYLVPRELESRVGIGNAVLVPLGRRHGEGFVVKIEPLGDAGRFKFNLKQLNTVLRSHQFFLHSQLPWFQWIAQYYGDNIASVLETAVPSVPTEQFKEVIVELRAVPENLRGAKVRDIFKFISSTNLPLDMSYLARRFNGARATLKKYIDNGIIVLDREEVRHEANPAQLFSNRPENLQHTVAQTNAIELISRKVDENAFQPFLLHGVTGSGKTEVYLEVARHALQSGKGVLILVPEIALTPQLIGRFQERLQEPIAVLHSAIHKRARWDAWRSLIEGKARVGLGARSAVFAPVKSLGLIVIDEEHDGSYKQSEGMRYHGRDIAVMRGKFENCPVILGSATPSLESWINAKKERYTYLSMPERPLTRPQPEVEIIDLTKIKSKQMVSKTISPRLHELLQETLDRGEQAFILYNRRGFATYLQCQLCAAVVHCPNCSVALTVHHSRNTLLCHYCGLEQVPSRFCSHCPPPPISVTSDSGKQSELPLMVERGAGTERAVEELAKLFPNVSIERLDRDAVSKPEELVDLLTRVRSGACQLLVGTQMIAKGHDIPNVTLVGVLDSDIGLHMPDFRAAERVFHLLTQVAGRAGRGERPGKVVLQTRIADHFVMQCVRRNNFAKFAEFELKRREPLQYPPYGKIVRVLVSSSEKARAEKVTLQLATVIHRLPEYTDGKLVCLGPASAPFERLRGSWRFHLLLKSQSAAVLSSISQRLKKELSTASASLVKNVKVIFDIDPQDML